MAKRIILGAVAILLVIAAAYASFYVAPEERTMGVIQRIFYFHVGQRLGRHGRLLRLLRRQSSLRLEARVRNTTGWASPARKSASPAPPLC